MRRSNKTAIMDQIDELYEGAVLVKNKIVQSNLRLVVSIAKRHVASTDDFFALVSDGNMSLIRAVEKFDYSRGNKFSTYASWAIMKNFARTIPERVQASRSLSHDDRRTVRGTPGRSTRSVRGRNGSAVTSARAVEDPQSA